MGRANRVAGLGVILIIAGCGEMLFKDAVRVEVPPEAVHLEIHPGAVLTTMPVSVATSMPAIDVPEGLVTFEPGAFQFQLDAPVQQDISLGKYSGAAAVVIGLLLLLMKSPLQWFRRGEEQKQT